MQAKRRTRISIFLLAFVMMLGAFVVINTPHADKADFKISVNKKAVKMTDDLGYPYIAEGNRTMVPLRVISENMGFKVDWKEANQEIEMSNDSLGRKLSLQIGNVKATVNGNAVDIDASGAVAPLIKGDRTYVPLRFIAENMGYKVDYKNQKGVHVINIYLEGASSVAGDLSEDELLNLTFKRIKERYETVGRPGDTDGTAMARITSSPTKGEWPGNVSDKWVVPDITVVYQDPWNNTADDHAIAPFDFRLNNKDDFKNAPDDWHVAIELIDERFNPYVDRIESKKAGHPIISNGKYKNEYDSFIVGNKLKEWAKPRFAIDGFDDLFVGNPTNYNTLQTKGKKELLAPPMGDMLRYKLYIFEGEEEHAYEFDVRYMFTVTDKTLNKITDPAIREAIKTNFSGNQTYLGNDNTGTRSAIFNIKQLY